MTPSELFHRAREMGLRLEARGNQLVVAPAGRLPKDFAEELRQNKAELLAWLRTPPSGPMPQIDITDDYLSTFPKTTRTVGVKRVHHQLPPDQEPWLHVASQVLAGEFIGCDSSTKESLVIGLRSIAHPACRKALALLKKGEEPTP